MKNLLLVAIKLCGLILIFYSLVDIPRNFGIYLESSPSEGIFFALLVSIVGVSIPLAIGLLLIFFVKMPQNDAIDKNVSNVSENLEPAAQRILGLLFIADGIANFVYDFSRVIFASRISGEFTYSPITAELVGSIISAIAEAGVGLWLLLGSVGLMRFIRKYEGQ